MHDEIINQAREILPQRRQPYRHIGITAGHRVLSGPTVKRNAAIIYSPIHDTLTTASAAHAV